MLTLKDAITERYQRLNFLILVLIWTDLIDKLFPHISKEQKAEIIKKSTYVNVELKQSIDFKDEYSLNCYFKGHAGFPGGETAHELGNYCARVSKDALPYLLDAYELDIDNAIKEFNKQIDEE